MTEPINHLDITQIEKFKNHSNIEMNFNHLGTKEDSDSSDETPFELEKMISELEGKPKPNLDETDTINVRDRKSTRLNSSH